MRADIETPVNTIPENSSSSSNSPNPLGKPGQSSKAWIAGAVIGPVVFLALAIAGGILLWRRRRRRRNCQGRQHPPEPDEVGKPELEGSLGHHVAGALGRAWRKPELDGGRAGAQNGPGVIDVAELGHRQRAIWVARATRDLSLRAMRAPR